MKRLQPKSIYTLGDYYKSEYLREDCHLIRGKNLVTMCDKAYDLAQKLPKDGVLIPVPSLSGYNEEFTRLVAYYANLPFYPTLARENLGNCGLYLMKKGGAEVTEADTGIFCLGCPPEGRLILIDNVIATGTTISACLRALGRDTDAACVAVDYNTYNKHNKKEKK